MTKTTSTRGGRAVRNEELFKTFLRSSASMMVVGGVMAAQAAYAQDAQDPETEEAAAQPEGNVIVVSGIRQSLANAQDLKRDSDTVVDAITAEDIGALPDRSVTEALQRVPGVAINRFAGSNDPDHFSVEGSGVVVRGLNFVRSEFNGRTAFAAGVGGQALNFADVPSELLGSVIISKNATADMIEGGLAGTVNLNTRKPFDNNGLKMAFSIEGNYGDLRKEWTPTISGLISNTWDTDIGRIGVLVSGAYSRIKSRSDGIQIANYQTRDGVLVNAANTNGVRVCRNPLPSGSDSFTLPPAGSQCGNFGTAGADGFADYADFRVAPVGGQFRTQDFDRKRDGIAVSAQWESLDERSQLTLEFIRSHTTNDWGEYTFETAPDLAEYSTYPIGCRQNADGPNVINPGGGLGDPTARAQCPVGGFTDYVYDDRGLFQSGYIVNASNGWRGNPGTSPFVPIGGLQQSLARRQVADETTNTDYSLNFQQQLTDRLSTEIDFQYAKSRKQNLDFSVLGSSFADQELDLTGDLPVVIPHKPQFLGYVWSAPGADLANATEEEYFNDPRFQFWRAAMDHIEDSTGTQYAFANDWTYEFDEDSFIKRAKIGARFQGREQTVRYTTYNWGMLSETWSGARPVNFADTPAGSSERYEFPNFFRGKVPGPPGAFYYAGDLTGDYEGSVDFFRSIQDQYTTQFGGSPTWTPLAGRGGALNGTPFIQSDIQPIMQDDWAAYAMVAFGSDDMFGGVRFGGNIGVRWVKSEIQSQGAIGVPSQQALNIADPFAVRCAPVVPPGSPPGTLPQTPGGVCTLGAAGYAQLQQFATGQTNFDAARFSYDYFLPSLNLRFGLTDDIILRLAGSKVLSRPENSYIRNFLTIGLGTSGELTATAGNPFLKPATAWQFDASLEWYFAQQVGSLTFNAFYKSVKDFFFQEITSRDITSNGVTQNVLIRGPANFDGTGKVKGFEVAYQQTYDFLPAPFDGLGVQANYTYIDSSGLPNTFLNTGSPVNESTVPPGNLPLEQLSKHNFNITAFYEKGPISLRAAYNWRSRFLLTASDVIFPYYSIFNEPTGQLDASVFFNLGDNLRVGIQGVNLLNEVTKTTQAFTGDPADLAPRSYFMNDRRFSFIIRGNF
ncbi:TonB-dependent receptor [Erythrobacter sp. SDW2]|uniref:TonB-dependent receptor n=1 Tax=Erythrobacter sp. SDW2 TaxID=2907154 RepID=UPI001F308139|nr:TonB-dependent receptor [Erythrobacter sp. SDW2]UIP06073.1 TonB-dependent receptor [Erythrobacter sp. SDW2]